MNDLTRKVDAASFSPKSSPRGSRSPMANPMLTRNDSTGTLKMTISAGKHPAVVHSGPFYLMKDPATENELTGATNLMAHYNLEHSYNKFTGKKVRDSLSSFLPTLPGIIDTPAQFTNSSLRSLIEKPPINKEFTLLNHHQLAAFRLQPGPLPEQYRFMNQPPGQRKHKKHKKHKLKPGETPTQDGLADGSDIHEKKHKKKKNDDDKERKKKKKEKKKKKQKHSPEYPGASGVDPNRIMI
ncbi:mediator of RNA polymerase II transcription subunit 19-like [Palaemon carinicauda]|uniref:mediator of RNA polymerase II transcription subunit 19-like n=1 Tax=Palaemon carinicauda TaxID=392227 RepID=UPI0035B581AB